MSQINLFTASLFVALFVFQTLRHRQFAWLAISVALFAAVQWYFLHDLSRPALAYVQPYSTAAQLYIAQAYILIGSIAYRRPKQPENTSLYLTSLIHANLAMHLAFFILIGCWWAIYPYGISPYFSAILYQLYALDPTTWLSFTAFLMLLNSAHQILFRQPENAHRKPSRRLLSISLLFALVMQTIYARQTLIDLFAQFQ
nr:hypothetical protein [uncultured Kingella sp.]